jgi:hypothetical protein
MGNPERVAALTQDNFGYFNLAGASGVNLNTTGNAVVAMPILSGGLTKGASISSSGAVIVRRVTIEDMTGSVASANISITTSNDGNISNAIVANVVLANCSAAGTYQDLTIVPAYLSGNAVSGLNTQTFFLNINVASGNSSNTVNIDVYGDVLTF